MLEGFGGLEVRSKRGEMLKSFAGIQGDALSRGTSSMVRAGYFLMARYSMMAILHVLSFCILFKSPKRFLRGDNFLSPHSNMSR